MAADSATPRQLEALRLIYEGWAKQEPPTVRELAQQLGVTSTYAVTCLLRRLERQGLIDHTQRRLVRVTEAGRAVLAAMREVA